MTIRAAWARILGRGSEEPAEAGGPTRLAADAAAAGFGLVPLVLPADRLDKLRSSIMGAWESALVWGGGDYLEQVWIPQYVGLVDVARAAEELYLHPDDADARARLRREVDDYLMDLESAKLRRDIYGRAADERFEKVRRLERVVQLVRAALVGTPHVCGDERSRADYETAMGQLTAALAEVPA